MDILVVDDHAAFADSLVALLGGAGHAVRRAHSCAAARAAATTAAVDVALVDLRLPDGDGAALAAELRRGAPAARVFVVSAQQADKLAAVSTMAAGLSHEIKNPLNAAALQLTVLERRLKRVPNASPELFEPLAIVQEEIKRLADFLDEFLHFARPHDISRAPMDAAQMIAHVVALLEPQATAAQLLLERRVEALPPLRADEPRLQQALVNLMLNAIQATPPGGWVRVEARAERDQLVLAVEDSGSGIPDDVRDRIFDPFFTTKDAGTGLGLPIVLSVVSQHAGTISAERGGGGGARFVMRLPLG
jgi:two-component system sensor histidine kinase HydH